MKDDLFRYAEARGARDEALEQVEANADPSWKDAAFEAVVSASRDLHRFTADDVFDRIPHGVATHEPRALGPVMLRAVRAGMIFKANVASIPSRRRSLHASPRTVWESRVTVTGGVA
jgi:hypothetical protein